MVKSGVLETGTAQSPEACLTMLHLSAATGNLKGYFGQFAINGVFLGTDPHERWTSKEFLEAYKEYFDGTPAWIYTLRGGTRNIYHACETFVTFDELLDSQDFGCISKGSGVMVKKGENWYILQYNLSFSVPNDLAVGVDGICQQIAHYQADS